MLPREPPGRTDIERRNQERRDDRIDGHPVAMGFRNEIGPVRTARPWKVRFNPFVQIKTAVEKHAEREKAGRNTVIVTDRSKIGVIDDQQQEAHEKH